MTSAALPDRLGRFEVQSPLGAGAFAQVVRAYDPQLSSSVAIKILADHWAGDADARNRFLTEARHLRRVRNPSVVAVHDIGELPDGRPYFVMELADRGSLEARLGDGSGVAAVSDDGIVRLIRGLSDGLTAIHDAGLVHRDLNPRNLLLRSNSGSASEANDRHESDEATILGLSIVRPDERVVIADLGLAKDLTESREVSVIGGSAGYQSPEQMSAQGELGPWSDVYAVSALLWHVLSGERPPALDEIEARRHQLPPQWRPLLRRGLDSDHGRRHQSIAEWAADALAVLGVDELGEVAASRRVPRTDECPYRGLASYEPEHAASFFGREDLVALALERLRQARVLAVLGASGSGKSSVVRAGIIPGIQAGELAASERWPVILMTPGSKPFEEMRYQLTRAADSVGSSAPDLVSVGGDPGFDWRRVADGIVHAADGLVVCVDQFEEIFTHDGDGSAADRFIEALAAMVDPVASRVRLVLSMRADFYGEAAGNPWLARQLADHQMLVGPMEPVQLRQAIAGPAEQAGLEIEDGLIDVVMAKMGNDPGSLPLLGHALVETWRRREGRRLTIDGFRQSGGVAGAIAQTAESVFVESLDAEQRDAARDLMLRLVTARQGSAHTRRRIPLVDLEEEDGSVTGVVVRQLVDARLLTTDDTTVQIAHEALITEWPRLRLWIDGAIDDLRLRSHLSRAAAEWRELDDDPAMLYRGTPLAAASDWARRAPGQLGPSEREFLDASEQAAATEEARIARDARRQRLTRGLIVGSLVALLVVAVIAWAGIQRTRSIERSNAAEARVLDNLGLVARLTASTDPLLGLALGVEARSLTDGPNRDSWLAIVQARRLLVEPGVFEIGAVDTGDALSVAVSPDGSLAAVGDRSGEISIVSLGERREVARVSGHEGGVVSLAFSADGTTLASGGFDTVMRTWDMSLDSPTPVPRLTISHESLVWDVAWSPDGTRLATASEDGTAALWDAATGDLVGEPLIESLDMLTVAFDPTGSALIASNGQGLVWGYSLPDLRPTFSAVEAHRSDVWELVFSPDGSEFLTSSSDGTVTVRRTADGSFIEQPFRDESERGAIAELRGAQFTPGGRGVIVGSSTGEILQWDRDTETIVARHAPTGGAQVLGSGFSGESLVTLARDQALRVWRFSSGEPLGTELTVEQGAHAVAIAADRSFVATGDGSGAVRLHDSTDGSELSAVQVDDGLIRSLAVSPDGAVVAAGTDDGQVVLIDVVSEDLTRLPAHTDRVRAMAYNPSGTLLATGGKDGVVRIWDSASGALTVEFGSYPNEGVEGLDWSPDGNRLAVVGHKRAEVWGLDGNRQAGPVEVEDLMQAVAFSADGELLAIGGGKETATIWSADLDSTVAGPFATLEGTKEVAFLDNDAVLLTVARDGTIRLWDIESGLSIGPAIASQWNDIRDVSVVDGPLFATASKAGQGWLWHLLDRSTACGIFDGIIDRAQPVYLEEGGELTACEVT